MLEQLPLDLGITLASPHLDVAPRIAAALFGYWWAAKRMKAKVKKEVASQFSATRNTPPMFPLKVRRVGGYTFGQLTFYGTKHLGTDWEAVYEPLSAPFDGEIVGRFWGEQGGLTLWFTPNHAPNEVHRFMHLKEFHVHNGQEVRQGQQLGVTGKSGSIVNVLGVRVGYKPHLHHDIWVKGGVVNHKDFSGFIDPEQYNWNRVPVTEAPTPPETPAPLLPGFPRKAQVTTALRVRKGPSTTAEMAEPWKDAPFYDVRQPDGTMKKVQLAVLKPDDTFTAVAEIVSTEPNGTYTINGQTSNVWVKSSKGNFAAKLGIIYP